MDSIPARLVKELRELTSAGMMDCKRALEATNGDIEKAIDYLREKGLAAAAKKADRVAAEGIVEAYIHTGSRVGVLLEVNCETDFVARNEEFQALVHDIAMHVAALKPEYVQAADVPVEAVEKERDLLRRQALQEGKPAQIVDRMVEGRLGKFFERVCLLEQAFIRDPDVTVGELVKQAIAKFGEYIQVRRFTRYEVGEGMQKRGESQGE